ncbi:probable 39S ribosomal protein L24, mitochondrial [Limulus polyphemus]|uniref:Large ribosomal subunit protein uL24m n=1 Tax=Limulus polyphemus TaxID=6850 RepID=A0ABM1BSY0_LIMPO|nr:probable 39S ribosomal protein L24, mitochondrial [Limulus polyphemus]XP_013788039.1 probable 39S ribosomal protein L24, mitochondrial [Limulus polyphemus]XP_013788047.1 probable 39S ribosomal protein L24, mitochondrial [Limulus polyphemus]
MRLFGILQSLSRLPKDYSNFPKQYVERAMEQVGWRTPKGPQYLRKEIKKKKFRYNMSRPWTEEFRKANEPGTHRKKIFLEPVKEWSFFRGDRVEVMVGKDKGKQGIVNYIVKERNWVVVEGLNCHYRFIGKQKNSPGVLVQSEGPLLVTGQVSLVDPSDNKPSEVEWRYTDEGEKVRVSVRTGRIIPIPKMAEETHDYKERSFYLEQPKDTKSEEISKITFEPKLMTFEQDIMNHLGIKEERQPHRTYWY